MRSVDWENCFFSRGEQAEMMKAVAANMGIKMC